MKEFDVNNVSQKDLAQFFGVDRTTIRAWQLKGLPYIDNGKGKAAAFIGPLAVRWHYGQDLGESYKMDVSNPLTAICFGYALDYDDKADKHTWTHESVLSDLNKCTSVKAEDYFQTFGYLAIVRNRQGIAV